MSCGDFRQAPTALSVRDSARRVCVLLEPYYAFRLEVSVLRISDARWRDLDTDAG